MHLLLLCLHSFSVRWIFCLFLTGLIVSWILCSGRHFCLLARFFSSLSFLLLLLFFFFFFKFLVSYLLHLSKRFFFFYNFSLKRTYFRILVNDCAFHLTKLDLFGLFDIDVLWGLLLVCIFNEYSCLHLKSSSCSLDF